ncbi:zinc finger protein VAR3, chloroplastic-like [Cornus florida]|uniref:zinc finger protein VAR3, chloroplastic-like n=1 Tax=Cornus florida TaxID=4283 RepID=UPI0028A2A223|nr:zinc finger protein VAR3, chloroplastic-like [Cornus florida]
MLKLLLANHGHHLQALKFQFRNPKFLVRISHIHSTCKTLVPNSKLGFVLDGFEELQSSKPQEEKFEGAVENNGPTDGRRGLPESARIQISHPWPEWVDLMERLLKDGYFDETGNPFRNGEMASKDSNQIRTACLNFARDKFDLIRYFSRKDVQVVAGSGCPSVDRKVVNSGKRLRAHVGIDEGNVCSSCILRGNCERAFVKAREDEGGRTVDVMRFLLTYGLDPVTGSVENKPLLNKRVKESVRRLLKEMVEFSMKGVDSNPPKATPSTWNSSVQEDSTHERQGQTNIPMKQGDWICPKCNFLNFARNIKCLRCDGLFQERLKKLGEDQEHLPLKKGDWICAICNFLNFAKNTRCLQCKEKPTKRQLNPGEWECESCNYINFRKNMVCLKCDHRRPKASNHADDSTQPSHSSGSYNYTQPSFRQGRQSGNRGVDMWRFVEDESEENDGSNSWNEIPGPVDFPIIGGKSDLSRNMQKQESWKMEMAERSGKAARARVNAHEFKSAITQSAEFLESTDDEEMAEWFGHKRNTQSDRLVSVPGENQD